MEIHLVIVWLEPLLSFPYVWIGISFKNRVFGHQLPHGHEIVFHILVLEPIVDDNMPWNVIKPRAVPRSRWVPFGLVEFCEITFAIYPHKHPLQSAVSKSNWRCSPADTSEDVCYGDPRRLSMSGLSSIKIDTFLWNQGEMMISNVHCSLQLIAWEFMFSHIKCGSRSFCHEADFEVRGEKVSRHPCCRRFLPRSSLDCCVWYLTLLNKVCGGHISANWKLAYHSLLY